MTQEAEGVREALTELSAAVDAMWNDTRRIWGGELAAVHVQRITAAQKLAQAALARPAGQGADTVRVDCFRCAGSGHLDASGVPCPACRGDGYNDMTAEDVTNAMAVVRDTAPRPAGQGAEVELDAYDAGLLGDGGGGDVDWWRDYIRAELSRAHDHYQAQVAALSAQPDPAEDKGACPVCGCEEVDRRDLWTCRCPAPARPDPAPSELTAPETRLFDLLWNVCAAVRGGGPVPQPTPAECVDEAEPVLRDLLKARNAGGLRAQPDPAPLPEPLETIIEGVLDRWHDGMRGRKARDIAAAIRAAQPDPATVPGRIDCRECGAVIWKRISGCALGLDPELAAKEDVARCGFHHPERDVLAPRELEVATFRDGRRGVGYSNQTEAGGFTILGWLPPDPATVPVPREPTEAMIEAAEEEIASLRTFGMRVHTADIWKVMVETALSTGEG